MSQGYVPIVIGMPNHIHALIAFSKTKKNTNINKIIGNGKRFLAYEIIDRLKEAANVSLLKKLSDAVEITDRKRGKLHEVYEDSFDIKECLTQKFIKQKLDYIHKNPVSKRWQLVNDYTEYPYSSASFYEKGIKRYENLLHVAEVW